MRTLLVVFCISVFWITSANAGSTCVSVSGRDNVLPLFAFTLSWKPDIEIAASTTCKPTVWISLVIEELTTASPQNRKIGWALAYSMATINNASHFPYVGLYFGPEKDGVISRAAAAAYGDLLFDTVPYADH